MMQHQTEVNDLVNNMNQCHLDEKKTNLKPKPSMGRSKNRDPRPKKVNPHLILKKRAASVTIYAGLNCF